MSQFLVQGMTCQGCVKSVTRALEAALPDARIKVELEGGKVDIDPAPDEALVRQAVEDAGFDYAGKAG